MSAEVLLLFPRSISSSSSSAGYVVHHPERRRLMPKVTLLPWRRLDGVCRFSVVQHKGHLYFLGGYKPAKKKFSKQVLRYEVSTGSWYYCNKMRTPRADFESFVLDGRIYCPGGRTSNNELTDAVESFEPVTNSWVSESPLPQGCAEFACLRLDAAAAVLLVGGVVKAPSGGVRCSGHAWRFGLLKSDNPYLDFEYRWQQLPDAVSLPSSRGLRGHRLLLDAAFNRVYVVGGCPAATKQQQQQQQQQPASPPGLLYFSLEDFKAAMDALDKQADAPVSLTWSRRRVPECSRRYPAVGLFGHKLFVVGGTRVGHPAPTTKEPQAEAEAPATPTEASAQMPEAAGRPADAGYYDRRRKTFVSLFSLANCGLDTSELVSVSVSPAASNKDLRQDRLDWLLQWALW